MEITKFGRATVIITTHYIDETRQAHMVGIMRGGKFLAEQSPDDLLKKYNADSLEDVFLKLSVLQNMGKRRRSSIAKEVIEAVQLPAMTASFNSICLSIKSFFIIFTFTNRIPLWTYRTMTITARFQENSATTFQCHLAGPTSCHPASTHHHCHQKRPPANPASIT